MKNLLIIQARTGSSRLPNKVLKDLCGRPMLQHIIERTLLCKKVDKVMVATTVRKEDNTIDSLCRRVGLDCYRGSENDVLDRYYQVAKQFEPVNIIRVTADCPLIDPDIIDEIVEIHEKGAYDYTSNTLKETYPDGLDTEVFKYSILKEAWEKASMASEREHVTPYIKFKEEFKRYSVERSPSLAEKRWTVDTDKDYEMISMIYNELYRDGQFFKTQDVLEVLIRHPEIEEINANTIRNEGYKKSIDNDYIVKGDM